MVMAVVVMGHIVSIPPPYPFNLIKSYLFSISEGGIPFLVSLSVVVF